MTNKLSLQKKIILCSAIFFATLSTIFSVNSIYFKKSKTTTTILQTENIISEKYYACLVGNYVVIYKDGQTEPYMTTDIDVRSLPETDKKMLIQGIILSDETAINHFLEDYGT